MVCNSPGVQLATFTQGKLKIFGSSRIALDQHRTRYSQELLPASGKAVFDRGHKRVHGFAVAITRAVALEAVDNYYRGGNPSNIEIFKNTSGDGEDFENPNDCNVLPPPAYDDKGNLYVQPVVSPSNTLVCELPAKGNTLEKVTLRGHVDLADNTIWDGMHIALVDAEYNGDYDTAIYQTKRLASGGLKVTGTTVLTDACHDGNSEITSSFVVGRKNTTINHEQGTVVIGCNIGCQPYSAELWRYPQAGKPFKTVPLKFQATGQSVSLVNH